MGKCRSCLSGRDDDSCNGGIAVLPHLLAFLRWASGDIVVFWGYTYSIYVPLLFF